MLFNTNSRQQVGTNTKTFRSDYFTLAVFWLIIKSGQTNKQSCTHMRTLACTCMCQGVCVRERENERRQHLLPLKEHQHPRGPFPTVLPAAPLRVKHETAPTMDAKAKRETSRASDTSLWPAVTEKMSARRRAPGSAPHNS